MKTFFLVFRLNFPKTVITRKNAIKALHRVLIPLGSISTSELDPSADKKYFH
ncbi:MAG: hypothetical protein U9P10_13125 [Thermodesulfobacteriota bacterium]|nr:hypothetical protein [Thermodesulfobacteriota bacterium]